MTWDEMVELAQCKCPEAVAWQSLDEMFRALRAAGVVMVPAEPTEMMIVRMALAAAAAAQESDRQWWADLIKSALSAGEIKPESE